MSKKEKLINRLKSHPSDFTWSELNTLLTQLGFVEMAKGKTGGSRTKFYHPISSTLISLHKPHPKPIIKLYAIKQVLETLKEGGLI